MVVHHYIMRSEPTVIPNDIVYYRPGCIAETFVAYHWHLFVLQTPEETFRWTIIPTVSTSGHTLLDPVSLQ